MNRKKTIIGSTVIAELVALHESVPAKIDTGADASSVWASDITVDDMGRLHYTLFAPGSEYYTGQVHVADNFRVAQVASSTGERQVRYKVLISMRIEGRRIRAWFNLSDRSTQQFPILIGRRTLKGRFLVDVSKRAITPSTTKTARLNEELRHDPRAFFEKYHK